MYCVQSSLASLDQSWPSGLGNQYGRLSGLTPGCHVLWYWHTKVGVHIIYDTQFHCIGCPVSDENSTCWILMKHCLMGCQILSAPITTDRITLFPLSHPL